MLSPYVRVQLLTWPCGDSSERLSGIMNNDSLALAIDRIRFYANDALVSLTQVSLLLSRSIAFIIPLVPQVFGLSDRAEDLVHMQTVSTWW